MKIKTREATPLQLNWLVAKIEGYPVSLSKTGFLIFIDPLIQCGPRGSAYSPTTDWSQGEPIIEREGINIFKHNKLDVSEPDKWCAHKVVPRPNMEGSTNMVAIAPDGPTPLIASMRCFVASKLGDEVDVPEELV